MPATYQFLTGWEFGSLGVMSPVGAAAASTTVKRTGTYSLKCASQNDGAAISAGGVTDTLYVGVAVYVAGLGGYGCLVTFESDHPDLALWLDADGQLIVHRNLFIGSDIIVSSGVFLLPYTWYYLEIAAKVNNTTGSIVVKANGSQIISFSGDTCYSQERIDVVSLGKPLGDYAAMNRGVENVYYDDFVIATGDWTGRGGVEALVPNGAGNSTDLTPSAGDNYAAVDEIPTDDDTTYVSGDTADDHDSYALSDLTLEGTVKAVQWNCRAKLAEEGSGSIKRVLRSGATDYAGDAIGLDVTYAWKSECFASDPATDAAWARAAVDALEAGVMIA